MSCRTFVIYGYGFEVQGVSEETFFNFFLKHKKTIKTYSEDAYKALIHVKDFKICFADIDDAFWDILDDDPDCYGCEMLVAKIMRDETGIGFSFEQGQDGGYGNPCILLGEMMPWQYNEKERALTQKDLEKILRKYAKELEIEDIGPQEIEYYG